MNVGNDDSDADQLAKAFAAAAETSFYLFYSFDMNYFTASGSSDTLLNTYLTPYLANSAYYLVDGAALVRPFHLFLLFLADPFPRRSQPSAAAFLAPSSTVPPPSPTRTLPGKPSSVPLPPRPALRSRSHPGSSIRVWWRRSRIRRGEVRSRGPLGETMEGRGS
jgi:hypothetical protein